MVEFKGQGPRDGDLDLVLTFVLYEKNVHQPWPLALKYHPPEVSMGYAHIKRLGLPPTMGEVSRVCAGRATLVA